MVGDALLLDVPFVMNISLLEEKTRIKFRKPGYASSEYYGALKRGVVWFGRRLWEKSMVTLSACCSVMLPSPMVVPYQRLKPSKSWSDLPDLSSPVPQTIPARRSTSSINDSAGSRRLDFGLLTADNTVVVKMGMLGDSQTGKTSLMINYTTGERQDEYMQTMGVDFTEKVLNVQNAKIVLSIWDIGGNRQFTHMVPVVCQDAAAFLITFDLTRRSTLYSVKEWFVLARKINKAALPVLVGTKFDEFVLLPKNVQLVVIKQARLYAQMIGAPLFFSSTLHNINVQKIFKVVMAKLFDLPCKISRNLTVGEPIIDF